MDVYFEWIVTAWESLSKEMLSKLFLVCGISNSHSGDEDDFINCFKPHSPVPEGRQMLEESRAGINAVVAGMEETDEEEEDKNGYVRDKSLQSVWNNELNARNPEFYAFRLKFVTSWSIIR
uniref:Uncharacterized protein n=1 Tax=Ditylenchus dipsaci TaxID=166011 RepID=A0A915CPX9_9BILA